MAKPRFRYLVFRDQAAKPDDGFILLDIDAPRPHNIPFLKDFAINTWSIPTDVITRNDLSVLGPLVQFPDEESARNSHQSAGKMTKLVGTDLEELEPAAWKSALETNRDHIFTAPAVP